MNSQEKNSGLRKPSQTLSDTMSNYSQGLSKNLLQNDPNLLQNDNKNRDRLSSGMLSAHSGSLSNIVSEGERGLEFRDSAFRRESYDDEGIRMRKASMPFIKTVMAEARTVDVHDFSIFEWIEFQEILKSNYFVIKNESLSKEKVVEELDKLIVEYNQLFLRIRENNERIRKKLEKEIIAEEEVIKALMDKDQVFGDAAIFAKKLLFLIHEKPKVLATLVKNYQEPSSLKALEETFCSTFYEDIISDESYDDDLIRLLAELLELEFEKATKVGDVFYTEHFTNKMLTSYLKRNECKMYVKSVLKNPLLSCIRETAKIRFDLVDIQKQLARKRKKTEDAGKPADTTTTRARLKTGSNALDIRKSMQSASPLKPEAVEEIEEISIPRFHDRKQKTGLTIHTKVSSEEYKAEEKPFEMIIESPESPMRKIQDREVVNILERNFRLLKKHLSLLIQSIFDSIHSMPIGVRILCKIIYMLAKKKFPNLSDKEYNEILGNFLFRKWINPNFISPEHNGILNDFQTNEEAVYNLTEIAKVLQNVFNQHLFSQEDVKSELNDYIRELMPSVADYYQEVIAVNEEVVNQIRRGKRQSPNKIKSISICISLHEIQLLCEGIAKQKEKMLSLSPEAVNLAEKVLFYDRETKLFGEKVDPVTKHKIKPIQCFILFHELIFPSQLISDYLGEFNKMPGFMRDQSEEQKLFCRVKHLMKNFLLNIEDIKNLVRLTKDGKMSMDDILMKYSDKIYSFEAKHASSKLKAPLHISSRFLISMLSELDPSYTRDNYYRLYQEMFTDFQKMATNLDFSISTTKLQLLKAYDALTRNFSALDEVNEKKKKAIKKSLIRDFIKSAKIPLCITSPSTTKTLGAATKGNAKKSTSIPEKVEVTVRDEKGCIHERFAIIRELAASNGGMLSGMAGRSYSNSLGGDSRKSVGASPNKEDIFNESNYHSKTIDEFVYIFANLQEVKDALVTGEDLFGVNEAITFFYHKIDAEPKPGLARVAEDEYGLVMDEIENYICKRLYTKIFPREKTEQDKALWKRCKVLEWVNFNHLEIVVRNRSKDMWEYAAEVLNEMDNRASPLEKLECMIECFRTITQVLELAASKEGAGSTDDTLPIMIYVIIKACPKRLHSNLNFISLLRDSERMLAGEGFCFTQVKSAVYAIETANAAFFRVSEEEYKSLIHAKEIEYAILIKKESETDFE